MKLEGWCIFVATVACLLVATISSDPGQPLFLTPYIQRGDIATAQRLSHVPSLTNKTEQIIQSYSGYITVNAAANGNLFFWFFPAILKNSTEVATVIWLEGGPGSSSLFSLFCENGPIYIDHAFVANYREHSLASLYNVIFIDNPVGTGFSFVDDPSGYRRNERDIASDLFEFTRQFYQLFPYLTSQKLYLSGESYAGKYVPAFAYKYLQENNPNLPIMGGFFVGNAYTDPLTMEPPVSQPLYNFGLLSHDQRHRFDNEVSVAMDYTKIGLFGEAADVIARLTDGDFWPYPTYVQNVTGCNFYYNVFTECESEPADQSYYETFVVRDDVRVAIHVGNKTYNDGSIPELYLKEDEYDTVMPWIEDMLTNQPQLKMLFYSGNLDLVVPVVSTDNFLRQLTWPHQVEWLAAPRSLWSASGSFENGPDGYATQVQQLSFVILRNAGHLLPYDQPVVWLKMADQFIQNIPFIH